jgi:site-specific DNA-adenine methylase
MRYQGGKSRIAKDIAAKIRELHPTATEIWEPFCGGGAVTLALAKVGFRVHASDNHEDLILMWQALMRGETEPFADVTEEEFKQLKFAEPSARRGFVRFGASFGGDFNGGYGRHHRGDGDRNRQYVWQDSQRSIEKMRAQLSLMIFDLKEYNQIPDKEIAYLDPPYFGVYAYQKRTFDHSTFWQWVRSRSGPTFISEITGPDDIKIVWTKQKWNKTNQMSNVTQVREERLYYKP